MRCHSVGCGTVGQTQLGFQSALIVERLRGQGYGDSPGAVSTSSARPTFNNRLSDTIECSQPLPKNFNPESSILSTQKKIRRRLNDVQDAASHRAVIRVYDESGNVIETHGHAGDFKAWWTIKTLASNVSVEHPKANVPTNSWLWRTDRRISL